MKIKKAGLAGLIFSVVVSFAAAQDNCPVVDYGDDICWYTKGIPPYREGGTANLGYENIHAAAQVIDLGGGTFSIGHPFSMEVPLNQNSSVYNLRGNNTRFYGGMKTIAYHTTGNKHHWTEGGINVNHNGFDDFNYMGFALEGNGNTQRAFGLWMWKKEDFLNGGSEYPVTFTDESRMAVYLSRTYPVTAFKDFYAKQKLDVTPRELWRGWEDVHLVVQDGDQFYIAETDFRPAEQTLFEVYPTQYKWAKYNPQGPWNIEWDHKNATFKEHTFTDVQAAGWMIAKPTAEIAGLWLKWYSFGMDAVVNRPETDAWNIPFVKNAAGAMIAENWITYAEWIKIYKWASRNQYCLHNGYNFVQDGNPGAALADGEAHSTGEPVTGITWQDAALWCNALSEYEGKTPCYYEDSAFTKPLRSVKDRSSFETLGDRPEIHLNVAANGYRLPTVSEWTAPALDKTLWSLVWDVNGSAFNSEQHKTRTVIGGSAKAGQLACGEIPSRGHYAIGFRPVLSNGKKPSFSKATENSKWSFDEEEVVGSAQKVSSAELAPEIGMVNTGGLLAGETEVSYQQWRSVYNWGEANGYRFDHDGDIGSLKWDNEITKHTPDEPVTAMSAIDAIVWCNALSEMKGFKPVYYTDKTLSKPLKTVHPARVIALPDRVTMYQRKLADLKVNLCGVMEFMIHVDGSANGYRLPSHKEWSALAGKGKYPSGETLSSSTAWFIENSGQKTHPVGETIATGDGFHDLAGNVFEWVLREIKPGIWRPQCRGGSHRSENLSRNAPMQNKFTALAGVGRGILVGTAKHEIGFRVVRNAE